MGCDERERDDERGDECGDECGDGECGDVSDGEKDVVDDGDDGVGDVVDDVGCWRRTGDATGGVVVRRRVRVGVFYGCFGRDDEVDEEWIVDDGLEV